MLYSFCCSPWPFIDAVHGKKTRPPEEGLGDGVLNPRVAMSVVRLSQVKICSISAEMSRVNLALQNFKTYYDSRTPSTKK
jgi:hypothetical protein